MQRRYFNDTSPKKWTLEGAYSFTPNISNNNADLIKIYKITLREITRTADDIDIRRAAKKALKNIKLQKRALNRSQQPPRLDPLVDFHISDNRDHNSLVRAFQQSTAKPSPQTSTLLHQTPPIIDLTYYGKAFYHQFDHGLQVAVQRERDQVGPIPEEWKNWLNGLFQKVYNCPLLVFLFCRRGPSTTGNVSSLKASQHVPTQDSQL